MWENIALWLVPYCAERRGYQACGTGCGYTRLLAERGDWYTAHMTCFPTPTQTGKCCSINGYIQKPVKPICFTVYYDRHLNTTGDIMHVNPHMQKEIKMWEVWRVFSGRLCMVTFLFVLANKSKFCGPRWKNQCCLKWNCSQQNLIACALKSSSLRGFKVVSG